MKSPPRWHDGVALGGPWNAESEELLVGHGDGVVVVGPVGKPVVLLESGIGGRASEQLLVACRVEEYLLGLGHLLILGDFHLEAPGGVVVARADFRLEEGAHLLLVGPEERVELLLNALTEFPELGRNGLNTLVSSILLLQVGKPYVERCFLGELVFVEVG